MPARVVNVKLEHDYDFYVGRLSRWGNPYVIGRDGTREEVIEKYREYILRSSLKESLTDLRGKSLACWCVSEIVDTVREKKECHAEILFELSNR